MVSDGSHDDPNSALAQARRLLTGAYTVTQEQKVIRAKVGGPGIGQAIGQCQPSLQDDGLQTRLQPVAHQQPRARIQPTRFRRPRFCIPQSAPQPNSCCGDKPCRRTTAHTESPLDAISATIRILSSSSQTRRRPVPENTSTRCAGMVLVLSSVTILDLAGSIIPQDLRSPRHSEGDAGTSLTKEVVRAREKGKRCSYATALSSCFL
jgi:hypothetical protein